MMIAKIAGEARQRGSYPELLESCMLMHDHPHACKIYPRPASAYKIVDKCTGLDVVWDLDLYGRLLETGGGKERMTAYFSVQSSTTREAKG